MNCLNRNQIQAYIDGETDTASKKQWKKHIASCSQCMALYQEAGDEIQLLNETLASFNKYPKYIPQPAGFSRRQKIVKNKHPNLLLKIVALVVIILSFTVILSRNVSKRRLTTIIAKTTIEIIEDQDMNEMWQENQSVIILTNNKGEVIQSGIF